MRMSVLRWWFVSGLALVCVVYGVLFVVLEDFVSPHQQPEQQQQQQLQQKQLEFQQQVRFQQSHGRIFRAQVLPNQVQKQTVMPESDSDTSDLHDDPQELMSQQERMCYFNRDYGIIKKLQHTATTFCQSAPTEQLTFYNHKGANLHATLFTDLVLDLRRAKVHKQIESIAQDGSQHDPRFTYQSIHARCHCQEEMEGKKPPVWHKIFYGAPAKNPPDACAEWDVQVASQADVHFFGAEDDDSTSDNNNQSSRVVLMARKDDHNPFFQIAATLNAWIMVQVVQWSPQETQLVYLDDGIPSPIDELQQLILSPNKPVVPGKDIMGKILHFDQALMAPFEVSGPMMRHLNDDEPCMRNELVSTFKSVAMRALDVQEAKTEPKKCKVTIITRRPYSGRNVQRKWLNEDEVMASMEEKYQQEGITCTFESIEFVGLTLREQMEIVRESDFVIGMHGAGMVNVFWTRPGTPVIEIFPRLRKRWGYRNLCQFVGCDWHEFRGGKDTGKGDNKSDKYIAFDEWIEFFDPLFQQMIQSNGFAKQK